MDKIVSVLPSDAQIAVMYMEFLDGQILAFLAMQLAVLWADPFQHLAM